MAENSWPVLLAMAGSILIVLSRFAGMGRRNTRIIERNWARMDAIVTINAMTRANARRTMELLMTMDPARAALIAEKIECNKRINDVAIKTLEQLIVLPEDELLLSRIKQARAHYLASLYRVGQLINEEQRMGSCALMLETTLPALDRLIESIDALWRREEGGASAAGSIL